jgi:hypothetical protein
MNDVDPIRVGFSETNHVADLKRQIPIICKRRVGENNLLPLGRV